MSDLELAKVKLIDTIGKYNLTASNIAKFKFSQLEENVFATMMVEFAQELANGVDASENTLPIQNVVCSASSKPQYCSDCKNYPPDNIEKHNKCKECYFIGNQQSNFEQE